MEKRAARIFRKQHGEAIPDWHEICSSERSIYKINQPKCLQLTVTYKIGTALSSDRTSYFVQDFSLFHFFSSLKRNEKWSLPPSNYLKLAAMSEYKQEMGEKVYFFY